MPLAVTYRPLKALIPYARNSRVHSPAQVAKLQGSLAEFGWTRPIAIADGVIIFGHGILAAALQMAEHGLPIPGNPDPEQGPTVDLSHLSKAQRRAYVIADNRLALDAAWDDDLLRIEMNDLKLDDFDLTLTGFDEAGLDQLFARDTDVTTEWQGMPGFSQTDKTAFRSITVHFKDQEAVDKFASVIDQTVTEKTKFVWFPYIEIETYVDKLYTTDDQS